MLRVLSFLFGPRAASNRPVRLARTRLSLEDLEGRCVPATLQAVDAPPDDGTQAVTTGTYDSGDSGDLPPDVVFVPVRGSVRVTVPRLA